MCHLPLSPYFLAQRSQNCTQSCRHSPTSTKQREIITSLGLLGTHLLMQPRRLLAFSAATLLAYGQRGVHQDPRALFSRDSFSAAGAQPTLQWRVSASQVHDFVTNVIMYCINTEWQANSNVNTANLYQLRFLKGELQISTMHLDFRSISWLAVLDQGFPLARYNTALTMLMPRWS